MSEPAHVSDWKPCTIIRGPLRLEVSGGNEYERKSLRDLIGLMLKETRLSAKVAVTERAD